MKNDRLGSKETQNVKVTGVQMKSSLKKKNNNNKATRLS